MPLGCFHPDGVDLWMPRPVNCAIPMITESLCLAVNGCVMKTVGMTLENGPSRPEKVLTSRVSGVSIYMPSRYMPVKGLLAQSMSGMVIRPNLSIN